MKKTNFIRAIVTFVFVLAGLSAFAQITAPTGFTSMVAPTGNDVRDTVTIGSVMPYRVTGDQNMLSLRNIGILGASQYTKLISAGGTLRNETGNVGTTPLATDSAFTVLWGTIGRDTVRITEVPQVVSGPAFSCTANTEVLPIVVIARPTAVWGTTPTGGCSIDGTTVVIPYTATGTGLFNVTYRIVYTNLSGTVTTPVNTGTVINSLGNYTASAQNFSFSYNVPALAYGRYDVYIENVTDRISRKSGVTTSLAADLPAAAATFYAYPTPVTRPINHVQNL